jgi:site-specific DNA-methyltransferase (adenine-specific)
MILTGDCRKLLKTLESKSIDCCITSPPYFGLRNYGHEDQLGLEKTPTEYVENLIKVFREVRRVLKDQGTLWLNLGDTYAMSSLSVKTENLNEKEHIENIKREIPLNLKAKDLIGIPWRVAFALQADGWYLRQDIIWHKPNAMPESVKDRCTKSHEYIFLLSKKSKYYFDFKSIKEVATNKIGTVHSNFKYAESDFKGNNLNSYVNDGFRNKRSVWTVNTKPNKNSKHFASFPDTLIKDCVAAGCPINGIVLDPFAGIGTVAKEAIRQNKNYVAIELNSDYLVEFRENLKIIQPTLI